MLKHVGIIMDGNRRWAKDHGLTAIEGHRAGYKALKALLPAVKRHKLEYLTVYAFSQENWTRSKTEVEGLMKLLKWVFKHDLKIFMDEGLRIRIIGSKEDLPGAVRQVLADAEAKTADNKNGTFGICFNYGGQQEVVDATKQLIAEGFKPEDITKKVLETYLYAADIPPLDLVIRTSGEERISGFMLWRAAYAELLFVEKHWPDFTETDFEIALNEYAKRQRRFGS